VGREHGRLRRKGADARGGGREAEDTRRPKKETWKVNLELLSKRNADFVAAVDRVNKETPPLPEAPHLAVGSVFAPYRVKQGIHPLYFVVVAAIFVAVSANRVSSSGGYDWPQFWLGVVVLSVAVVGTAIQAVQFAREVRRDRKIEEERALNLPQGGTATGSTAR
jgi:hypothetical protein